MRGAWRSPGLSRGRDTRGTRRRDACATHLAEVIDADNVRVTQPGQRAGFAREAFGEAWIAPGLGRKNLQGYQAVEAGLAGFIDRAHAASPDQLKDFELGKELGEV